MDSRTTHALCLPCWGQLEPGKPPRAQFEWTARQTEICCRCAARTHSGIYYQAPPLTLACLGRHAAQRASGPAAPDDTWQLAYDQLELEQDQAAARRITMPRAGDWIRPAYPSPFEQPFRGPFDPYLPTMPGTLLELGGGTRPGRHRSRRRRLWNRIRQWFTHPPGRDDG